MFETEAVRENYELGVLAGEARERERIVKALKEELESLKKYGRTELWGIHKALHIVTGEV